MELASNSSLKQDNDGDQLDDASAFEDGTRNLFEVGAQNDDATRYVRDTEDDHDQASAQADGGLGQIGVIDGASLDFGDKAIASDGGRLVSIKPQVQERMPRRSKTGTGDLHDSGRGSGAVTEKTGLPGRGSKRGVVVAAVAAIVVLVAVFVGVRLLNADNSSDGLKEAVKDGTVKAILWEKACRNSSTDGKAQYYRLVIKEETDAAFIPIKEADADASRWKMALFEFDCATLLDSWEMSSTDEQADSKTISFEPGTYYVVVRSDGAQDDGYGFTVSKAFAQTDDDSEYSDVLVKDKLEDYSWDELKSIARQIGAAEDKDTGLLIAQKYNLVDKNKKIDPKNTKTIKFEDGSSGEVQMIDFRHDDKADGSGRSGITFLFTKCVDTKANVNPDEQGFAGSEATTWGGWEQCYLRRWLQSGGSGGFWSNLPEDLRNNIEKVQKSANNQGIIRSSDDAPSSFTADTVWLLSAKEICGHDTLAFSKDRDVNKVLHKAGWQYKFFEDEGIKYNEDNEVLERAYGSKNVNWWLRDSASKNSDISWRLVSETGNPSDIGHIDRSDYGVVPGFCL